MKGPGVVRIAEAYLPLGMHFKLYLDGRLVEDIDTDDTGVGFVGARTLERAYNHNVRVVLSNGAVTALSCELVVRGEYGRFTRY